MRLLRGWEVGEDLHVGEGEDAREEDGDMDEHRSGREGWSEDGHDAEEVEAPAVKEQYVEHAYLYVCRRQIRGVRLSCR